jgi:hypothetical protein
MNIRLATVVLLAAINCGALYAAKKTSVDVYVNDHDDTSELLGPGRALASAIFDRIGVRLIWHRGELPVAKSAGRTDTSRPVFGIRTVDHRLESAAPGALASARIVGSSGTEIVAYKDRLQRFLADSGSLSREAAAYVLAHELAHVMQGVARHSDSGIMKAIWSSKDCDAMASHQLAFTRLDIELIHQGLAEQRASRSAEPISVAENVRRGVFNIVE